MENLYAEILIPQKIARLKSILTYKVPDFLANILQPGHVVKVPLKSKKINAAIIKLTNEKPMHPVKELIEIVNKKPYLQSWQIQLMFWISEYYCAPLHKTLQLFIPKTILKRQKNHINEKFRENMQKPRRELRDLTLDQKKILDKMLNNQRRISLIQDIAGVTKTAIYLHAAKYFIEKQKQVLFLVPEISLTPQMIAYFESIFPGKIAVIHSGLTNTQKTMEWKNILENRASIIIGSRSALFAPFQNLGLIIMDEEHETSYKQEQNPRYHARDVVLKIADFLPSVKIILGSAAPSVESYYRAEQGEFNLFTITRSENRYLPKISIIDMRNELKKKNISIFSEYLRDKIARSLSRNERIVLFLNKRGTSSAVICRECGYAEKCAFCSTAMTYHSNEKLICHHCGFQKSAPAVCPNCKGTSIRFIGLGTEKAEREISLLFPDAKVIRIDKDITKKHSGFKKNFSDFDEYKADILIGTQLINHRFVFSKANLIGIILADIHLLFPDFRTGEKTFQLLVQIAGRVGHINQKNNLENEMIIQTYMPDNQILRNVQNYDYLGMYKSEISQRRIANYPPFSKLIKLTFSHQDEKECIKAMQRAKNLIQEKLSELKLTAEMRSYPAYIRKIKNRFMYNILIKGKNLDSKIVAPFQDIEDWKIDVDPISTL